MAAKRRKPIYMPYGCLYLNQDGSRWITNDMQFVLVLPDGTRKVRKADYIYSFGNFAGYAYRYKGKREAGLPQSFSDEKTGLPVIFLVWTQAYEEVKGNVFKSNNEVTQ